MECGDGFEPLMQSTSPWDWPPDRTFRTAWEAVTGTAGAPLLDRSGMHLSTERKPHLPPKVRGRLAVLSLGPVARSTPLNGCRILFWKTLRGIGLVQSRDATRANPVRAVPDVSYPLTQ